MATPTAIASKNTPSHLAFSSPAPRSVPSPAAQRNQQAGKSPFPSSQPPSSTIAAASNHPTTSSTGGRLGLGSSPAAGMFDSPAAMALNLSSMSGLDGGVGMGISMSQMSGLGLGLGSVGARADEEERRRRLEGVVSRVGAHPGRVSRDGIERVGKRLGLEVQWEPAGDARKKTALIPGPATFVVEVDFDADSVQDVRLTFPLGETTDIYTTWTPGVLKNDLTPPRGVANINHTLECFSNNLQKLAQLDKLSTQQVNCFDAISGVYKSLKRLFEHEKATALAVMDTSKPNSGEIAEREVMCKRSGRPMMNAGRTMGLSLQYWMDQRNLSTSASGHGSSDRMEVDNEPKPTAPQEETVYSLSIECESSPAELYPSIRISEDWISEQIEKPATESDLNDILAGNTYTLDWLDPLPTYQPAANEQQDTLNLDAANVGGKLPNVRFIAKLNPPLVVPLQVAIQILNTVGVTVQQDSIKPTTFAGLLLRPARVDAEVASGVVSYAEIANIKDVVVPYAGTDELTKHKNTLFSAKIELGRVLDELPFLHPRQLVEALPLLRQYAYLNSLLKAEFIPSTDPPFSPEAKPVEVDMNLTTTTVPPHLTLAFPRLQPSASTSAPQSSTNTKDPSTLDLDSFLESDAPLADNTLAPLLVTVEIGPNGELSIAGQNAIKNRRRQSISIAGGPGKDTDSVMEEIKNRQRLIKALDLCGDLGVWTEWMRQEAAK